MIGRAAIAVSSVLAVALTAACTSYYEIPVETREKIWRNRDKPRYRSLFDQLLSG